jgi:hypothetical protein
VTVIIPEACLGCKAARKGIQEGRAYYSCGSVLDLRTTKIKVKRSLGCIERQRKGDDERKGEILA